MIKSAALALIVAAGFAPLASAQCEVSSKVESKVVPPEKMSVRNAIYQKLCQQVGGALVDGDDAALRGRLAFPDLTTPELQISVDEDMEYLMRTSKKPVVVVYIVEPTGKVSWAAVLDSAGNTRLDSAAITMTKAWGYKGPPTLDKQPVRVFSSTALFGPRKP